MAGYGPFNVESAMKPTEYGGHEGLVQVGPDGPKGVRVHELTASEKLGMANRLPGGDSRLVGLLSPEVDPSVDPVTGLVPPRD